MPSALCTNPEGRRHDVDGPIKSKTPNSYHGWEETSKEDRNHGFRRFFGAFFGVKKDTRRRNPWTAKIVIHFSEVPKFQLVVPRQNELISKDYAVVESHKKGNRW